MDIATFIREVGKLKDVKRTGWVERGVKGPESVADHSFIAALMCMVLPAEGVDMEKVLKMVLVHDLPEAVVGDLITRENWPDGGTIAQAEKSELEEKALKRIVSDLDAAVAKEITSLWKEFEEQKTKEAVFARDFDIAECIIQAHVYHSKGNSKKPLKGFWDERNTNRIQNENIKKLVMDVIKNGK